MRAIVARLIIDAGATECTQGAYEMKIGLQIVKFDWPAHPANTGAKLAEIARTADAVGFDSLWVMDHSSRWTGRRWACCRPSRCWTATRR